MDILNLKMVILGSRKPKYSMVWSENCQKVVIYHNVVIIYGMCHRVAIPSELGQYMLVETTVLYIN